MRMSDAVDIAAKFGNFSEHWRPRVAAQLNGQYVLLVKTRGVFPWHTHRLPAKGSR